MVEKKSEKGVFILIPERTHWLFANYMLSFVFVLLLRIRRCEHATKRLPSLKVQRSSMVVFIRNYSEFFSAVIAGTRDKTTAACFLGKLTFCEHRLSVVWTSK